MHNKSDDEKKESSRNKQPHGTKEEYKADRTKCQSGRSNEHTNKMQDRMKKTEENGCGSALKMSNSNDEILLY